MITKIKAPFCSYFEIRYSSCSSMGLNTLVRTLRRQGFVSRDTQSSYKADFRKGGDRCITSSPVVTSVWDLRPDDLEGPFLVRF